MQAEVRGENFHYSIRVDLKTNYEGEFCFQGFEPFSPTLSGRWRNGWQLTPLLRYCGLNKQGSVDSLHLYGRRVTQKGPKTWPLHHTSFKSNWEAGGIWLARNRQGQRALMPRCPLCSQSVWCLSQKLTIRSFCELPALCRPLSQMTM